MSEKQPTLDQVIQQYPHDTGVDLTQAGPWEMPPEIWWNLRAGSTVRRAQWVIDNCPGVSLEELTYNFALQDQDVAQLDLSNRQRPSEEPPK